MHLYIYIPYPSKALVKLSPAWRTRWNHDACIYKNTTYDLPSSNSQHLAKRRAKSTCVFSHLRAFQRFSRFNCRVFHFNMLSRKFAARSSPFSRFLLGDFRAISLAHFIASSSAKAWKNLPFAPWSQLHILRHKFRKPTAPQFTIFLPNYLYLLSLS